MGLLQVAIVGLNLILGGGYFEEALIEAQREEREAPGQITNVRTVPGTGTGGRC